MAHFSFQTTFCGLTSLFSQRSASHLTLVWFVAALAVAVTTRRAEASDRRTTAMSYSISSEGREDKEHDQDVAGTSLVISFAGSASGGTHGSASTYAGFKKVAAKSISRTNSGSGSSLSSGNAKSTDNLTLDVKGARPGVAMNLLLELSVEGELTGGATCPLGDAYFQAYGGFSIRYGPPNQYPDVSVAFGIIDNDSETPDSNIRSGTVPLSLDWVNGAEYSLQMIAYAGVDSGTIPENCTAHADAELSHTFKWMGVVGVTDDLGNIYSDFTLTDEYGNNWKTPVNDADVTSDGHVNANDLLAVINSWGPCVDLCEACLADIAPPEGDCQVNVSDLLMVINNWGG